MRSKPIRSTTARLPLHHASRWLIVGLTMSLSSRNAPAQETAECRQLDAEGRSRIQQVAARQLRTGLTAPVIERATSVPGTCYIQLLLSLGEPNRRAVLYLSPDRRFLSTALWDLSVDPAEAEARLADSLRRAAEADRAPGRGPDSAAVTLIVFSDFQCPYCAALANMLRRYQIEKPNQFRVLFRNYPLPIHDWAARAARAAICISTQSTNSFWEFHDLLLSHQKSLSTGQLYRCA